MNYPSCRDMEFHTKMQHGQSVYVCPECTGIWLEAKALDQLWNVFNHRQKMGWTTPTGQLGPRGSAITVDVDGDQTQRSVGRLSPVLRSSASLSSIALSRTE